MPASLPSMLTRPRASLQGLARRLLPVLLLCTTLAPPAWPASRDADLARAQELALAARHEEAAVAYERVAGRGIGKADPHLLLRAAGEYLAAGRLADCERLLGRLGGGLSPEDARLAAGTRAELALVRKQPRAALAALAGIGTSPGPELLELRARAQFADGQLLAGLRSLEARGALLGSAEERAANDLTLLAALGGHGGDAAAPAEATERERGWFELVPIRAQLATEPEAASAQAREWSARHPGHPGLALLPAGVLSAAPAGANGSAARAALVPGTPTRIALLLPLSGRNQAVGEVVRDGFLAAALADPAEGRPAVAVLDTAGGVTAIYQRALAEGASIVVGPLLREDLAALAAGNQVSVPTLGLNRLPGTAPAFLYQFGLDPEQEARAVARRIALDGRRTGIALLPRGSWGQRVHDAFAGEAVSAGLTLTAVQFYDPAAQDFSGALRLALGRYAGAGERDAQGKPRARDAEEEQRSGPQFVFLAAPNAKLARAMVPQLRFQMVYAVPVYATGDAWDPALRSAADLEGLTYPEMPWLLYGGQGAPALWSALQGSGAARSRLRLYAFGFDAWRLARDLGDGVASAGLDGLTGRLLVGPDGRVQRESDWARVERGQPQPAPSGPPAPAPRGP